MAVFWASSALVAHNGLLEASSKQSKNQSRSNGKGERQRVCVERKVVRDGRPASRCRDI